MKKLLALVLAFALAVSTSVTAFAEDATTTETNDSTKNTEIAVNGSYQAGTPAGSSISVDVVWEDMSFTYTGASKGAWDPKNHEYGADIPAHWAWSNATEEKTAPNITLTNHSDTGVKVKFVFNTSVTGLNATFTGVGDTPLTDNALTLPTAVETDPANAPSAVTSFSVDGSGIDNDQQLGSITVTVAKDGTTGGDEDVWLVNKVEDLESAGGYPESRLMTDLTVDENLSWAGFNSTFDMNGKTLTLENNHVFTLEYGESGSINNGTINGRLVISDTNELTMNGCTVESSEGDALEISVSSSVTLNNCTLRSPGSSTTLKIGASTVTLSGKTTITSNGYEGDMISLYGDSTLTCLAGTYNFDPSAYVGTGYTVTNDGSGTWTVAESATGGETAEA